MIKLIKLLVIMKKLPDIMNLVNKAFIIFSSTHDGENEEREGVIW